MGLPALVHLAWSIYALLVFVILQFKMEMAQTDSGNTPRSYSLNMFKDFVPMCVISESNQGTNPSLLVVTDG